jgi:hypothetical protein
MTAPDGPFLYDDGPAPLHTGTPRSGKILALVFGATVVVAVLMVFLTVALRGSGAEQAEEVSGVFLAALSQDDLETSYELLCQDERIRLDPEELAAAYLRDGDWELGAAGRDGDARLVPVEWADGTASTLTVIGEDGLRVCGITPAG